MCPFVVYAGSEYRVTVQQPYATTATKRCTTHCREVQDSFSSVSREDLDSQNDFNDSDFLVQN